MDVDYFSLHDILCEEQWVKVRFVRDVQWTRLLAFGDESMASSPVVRQGTIAQLPFWLGRALCNAGAANLLPPKQFGARTRADLAADPAAVNLKELSPYWYDLGIKVSRLLPTEGIARILFAAQSGRLGFLSRALFSPSELVADPHASLFGYQESRPSALLDHAEIRIFRAATAAVKDFDEWASKASRTLRPLEIFDESGSR